MDYKYIMVCIVDTVEEAEKVKYDLFVSGIPNVSTEDSDNGIIVKVIPGPGYILEDIIDDIIVSGFYDAILE